MKEIIMPKRGQAMEEGTLVEWHKVEGDFVNDNEVIASIETDKVVISLEAPLSGYLHILVQEGTSVPIGQTIAVISETKEEYDRVLKKEKNI